MKSLHDYRGEYAAALKRYKRAARRWWRLGGTYESMLAKRDAWLAAMSRCHLAHLNKPKRKTSKRAKRRARAYLASLARLIEQNRTMGPRLVRIHVRDASELPAVRVEMPADDLYQRRREPRTRAADRPLGNVTGPCTFSLHRYSERAKVWA